MAIENDEPTEVPPLYIRERMKALRITGEKLADRMNTTPATVSRLLNGKRQMTLGWLFAFAKALNAPISSLFSAPTDAAANDPDTKLQSALIAFGVDGVDLEQVMDIVRTFAPASKSEESLSQEQPPHAIRHREPERTR